MSDMTDGEFEAFARKVEEDLRAASARLHTESLKMWEQLEFSFDAPQDQCLNIINDNKSCDCGAKSVGAVNHSSWCSFN